MPIRSEKRTIDGLDVTVTQLSAMRALALLPRIGKALAPAVEKLDPSLLSSKAGDVQLLAIVPVLTAFFSALDSAEATDLIRQLNVGTTVAWDGKFVDLNSEAIIDLVFTGRLPTLLKVTAFALEVNFGGFFDGLPASRAAPVPTPNG